MKRKLSSFLLITLLGICCFSCKNNKEIAPSVDFAPYISAYTGGVVSSQSPIRIQLTQNASVVQLNSEIKEKLFDFSPSLKGKAYWVSNNTIEFMPDSGQLKPGTLYNGEFKLSKVMKVDKKAETFPFSFHVIPQDFSVESADYSVSASNLKVAKVSGKIKFSDIVSLENVKKMVTFEMKEDKSYTTKIEQGDNNRTYLFTVENIKRGDSDRELFVKITGKPINSDKIVEEPVLIPGMSSFKVISAETIEDPESGVQLVFSEPVSTKQNLKGLIELPEVSSYVFQVKDNHVNVFFEKNNLTTVTVNIDQAVKNSEGRALKSGATFSLEIKSSKPKIELSGSGLILPDSKNLILPFKSVNLCAVDLRIIRIFESNVLMFLQANKLTTSDELRRSGRLIYKKTLRLDQDPAKKLNRWNDFSIDLSQIIKQEPGAIYRIELSFKQAYSTYSCEGESEEVADAGLSTITPIELDDDNEDEIWDRPQPYYWSQDDYDWNEYNWDDVENPCKPSYYMSSENTRASCNVLASNLGIIAKGNSDKKLWVTINDILTTNPMSGAEVKAYNYQLQEIGSGKTDGDGFAVLDLKGKPFILKASSGQQLGYLRLVDGEENSLSHFDVGGKETQKGLKGFVFGERGVWRPGDTLHISFILEDRAKRIPQNHPVSLELYNPKGQFYTKLVSTNGINGFYTFNVPTNPDDLTGFWNAYVKIGGASFHKALRIETVKPNRLKINLDIPGNKINASSSNTLTLSSNWLTGAIAKNLKASVEMSLSKMFNTQFKGYEKYNFNNPATLFNFDKVEVFKGNLNDEGVVKFNLNAPEAADAPGMLQATFSSRVFEPGGDVSTYIQSVTYSPFSSYVGIYAAPKESKSYFETDVSNVFEVATVNSDGKPVDRQNLDYRVYKLSWSWWWESNGKSLDNYVNNTSNKPILSEKITTVNGRATARFKIDYPEWGRYFIYIKDKQSGHATGQIVYVDWPEFRGRAQKKDPEGLTMLSFTKDKESYEVGENVTITIPQSAGGRALVALENGTSVLSQTWVDVSGKGDTKYSFKVTEEMAPNFYIHISLLQPHAQTVNSLPIRMYGVMPVSVNNKNSVLEPEIKMPDSLEPEKEFTVNISEKSGKAMTYTLAIVDDGLLDLTAFKTPNPWNEFYAREAIGIKTWDMYDFVIGAYTGKFAGMFSIGGDQSLKPGEAKAKRFKPVVKFIGPFTLKKGETKSHKLQLPMYVGSVRTMVVAAQEGAYGNAEKTVTVKNPLMILPTLPRVVSVGEEIVLPVNVFAMEPTVKDVNIKVETSGLTKVEKSSQSMRFSKVGDEMAYFTLKVGEQAGVEKIKVSASGNGNKAEDVIEIQVRNPNPAVISNVSKLLSASQEETFDYSLSDLSNESWVKMEVSRIPSVDLSRRFDYLMSYEHCCTEQLVSKAFPLLYIGEFKNMTEKELEMTKANVREAIRQLYGRQYQHGGFMYWPGYEYSNPWISSYAGQFLLEARQKGYDVNQGVINRWLAFQRKAAQTGEYENSRYSYYQYDLQQAYCLYTLALSGNPEIGAMNRLKERKSLSPQAAWRLAAAYALCGKTNISNELVFNVRTSIDPYSSNNSSYGSSGRDEAMILESLVLMGNMQKSFEQAKKISKNLSAQYYFDTQTTAYSLLAMGKLAEKSAKGMIEFNWSVNGKSNPEVKIAKAAYLIDVAVNKPQGNLKVKNISQGDLFVMLTSKYKPLNDTLQASSQNIKVEVSYTDLSGSPVDIENLKQGTDFKAIVKVSNISGNNDYNDLALTHIVPSGWEIFNERMEQQEGSESVEKKSYTYRDIRDDRVFTYFELMRSQSKTFVIRLNAAYTGKFTLPAIQCESMYDTQAHARTKAGKAEVVR